MEGPSQDCKMFLDWFQRKGGTIDLTSMGLTEFPASEGGRGAVALQDIPGGHVLFSVPRDLTLSTRTSTLPTLFGLENWKKFKLHEGWAGLMLSMMWEAAQGPKSKWTEYMSILPGSFDTPMFWDEKDLAQLQGTSIVKKLGKEDAEDDYKTKVLPALESRPDLFPASEHAAFYSFHTFHLMGSRILSRSFGVEKWQPEEGDKEDDEDTHGHDHAGNVSVESAMDVDEQHTLAPEAHAHAGEESHSHGEGDENDEEEDGDQEEAQDSSDTAMVPMADMLNARFGSENAKLFHEKDELKMISTKPIKAGEQIWNTYGDLPNSELLRRYGHVDILTLPTGEKGNPGDVAEIRADGVVEALKQIHPKIKEEVISDRIDWWLEEGGDDTYEFDWDLDYPDAALSIIRLFLLSEAEWTKARDKSKPPKPKADVEVLTVLQRAVEQRMQDYATTIEEDEALLTNEAISLNLRQAIIVRLGEKKVLNAMLSKAKSDIAKQSKKQTKRKSESQAESKGSNKKSRR